MEYTELLRCCIFSTIACAAFAVSYNIRPKNLIIASLAALLTECVSEGMMFMGSDEFAACFAAGAVGALYSEIMARILKNPANMYLIISIIPLVPGGMLYSTMSAFVSGDINKGLELSARVIGIAGAIAVGVFFVFAVFKCFTKIIIEKR